jgi:hypothetical protein
MESETELLNSVALMFFDTMSVGCVASEYARAVIRMVRDHDKEVRVPRKIGEFIHETVRNEAASLGLEYPYVFAHNLEQYLVWHRTTGEIVWVGEEGLLGSLGYSAAWKKAEELNGFNPYAPTDQALLNDIDQET